MLSKNKLKLIDSLSKKKKRDETGLFMAEGSRLVDQLLHHKHPIQTIIAVEAQIEGYRHLNCEKITVTTEEIRKISLLKTPPDVIAICHQASTEINTLDLSSELIIVLDDIQDPGNLGTLIRLASWFGVKNIVCSNNTADCYNPKVVQSTMGAIAKVSVHYTDLQQFLIKAKEQGSKIYGTLLKGENIYSAELSNSGIVIFGNEGNGISPIVESFIDQRLLIPSFSVYGDAVESLNVASAASIVCSEFRRRFS